MPVFDNAGALITSLAFLVVIVGAACLLQHWIIRSAVGMALRRQHLWLQRWERAKLPSGSADADLPRGWGSQP